jgi:hypothetical protein
VVGACELVGDAEALAAAELVVELELPPPQPATISTTPASAAAAPARKLTLVRVFIISSLQHRGFRRPTVERVFSRDPAARSILPVSAST